MSLAVVYKRNELNAIMIQAELEQAGIDGSIPVALDRHFK